jgi:hypothetical protein
LIINGKVNKLEEADGNTTVHGEVLCRNHQDEAVITGDIKVRVGEK